MLSIEYPWVLLLFFLPFLLQMIWRHKKAVEEGLVVPFFLALKRHFGLSPRGRSGLSWVYCLIWFILILALASPVWIGQPIQSFIKAKPMMLALDISGSMSIDDMVMGGRAVDRLTVVKKTALSLIEKATDIELGLILFGSKAYLKTPFTLDKYVLSEEIKDATVGLAGNNTAIGDALGLAIKQFQSIASSSKVVILLTDGVNNAGVLTPRKAASLAKSFGVKVYTIGLIPDIKQRASSLFLFSPMENVVDEDTLKMIAEKTKGHYFRATDEHSLDTIFQDILMLEANTVKQPPYQPKDYLMPYLIGLALMIMALNATSDVFRWRLL